MTFILAALILVFGLTAGCRTPEAFRRDVDTHAGQIITQTRSQVLDTETGFYIEKSEDTLRRRLLEQLSLPVAGPASFGTDRLPGIAHWPEPGFPASFSDTGNDPQTLPLPLTLTLFQALEISARNSFDYQTRKETVFQAALALYLEQDQFRNRFIGQVQQLFSADLSTDPGKKGTRSSVDMTGARQFESGAALTTSLAVDLATLLFSGGGSSVGIAGDASLSIPLLRGSGRHIVMENLRQAEQNMVYAILEFERFKKTFAVAVGSQYLNLLQQMDTVDNAREDYSRREALTLRSRRLGDAGRLKGIQVDQSVQTQLVARQRWLSAKESFKKQMDSFKILLGLPPDADIQLDPGSIIQMKKRQDRVLDDPGPLELAEQTAVSLALERRLDLQIAQAKVFDAQRKVVVAADALGAELTFLGSASAGERRTITSADLDNAALRMDKGVFSALLTLDLPFERTAEAVTYRNRYIELAQAVRDVQKLEDTVKIEIRNRLRELFEARKTLVIQAQAVALAEKRVKSISLFMEAGRAETRDLLEAQDALLTAQNSLTAARVDYRIAELEMQRDMGVLMVTDTGLWKEYLSEGTF
ncbi:MAG: TolC family protein [Desulfotignum sp.]|nr:TolC family protein [Desulfotignum sp.]